VTPLARALALMIRGYRRYISPLTPRHCRYAPTCSRYALVAIETHGAIKGTYLAVRRILRCHPWSPGGVDHVPGRRAA